MTPPVLSADSLGKRFGRHQVLKGASFDAVPGRVTAIMGRNGSGKSTLLDLVAGVKAPDFGTIRFADRIWERPRLAVMARHGLYYLHQQAPLSSRFLVVDYFRAVVRRFGGEAMEAAVELLRLGTLLDDYPHALSGGERARVALGLALTRQPTCLLADEPFAGLAPLDQELVASGLARLSASGCGVAVTGHDVPILFDLAGDVVWVVAGTTESLGSPAEAATHDRFRRDYLGPGTSPPTGS